MLLAVTLFDLNATLHVYFCIILKKLTSGVTAKITSGGIVPCVVCAHSFACGLLWPYRCICQFFVHELVYN